MLDQRAVIDHWKAKGLDFSKAVHQAGRAAGRRDLQFRTAGPQARERAGSQADRAGDACARPRRAGAHFRRPSRTSTAAPARCCRAKSPSATAMKACRTTPIHVSLNGTSGQSFGAWLAKRRHLRARRRRQRLCRQGPVRRPHHREARRRLRHRAGRVDHRRQHRDVRRDLRRMLFPRHCRRALRRAQLRRRRRCRRHRRSRLRIHDRRHRRRARPDRAQLRGRHVGRHRLCARRGPATSTSCCNMSMVELEPVPAEEDVNERFYHSRNDLETAGASKS